MAAKIGHGYAGGLRDTISLEWVKHGKTIEQTMLSVPAEYGVIIIIN